MRNPLLFLNKTAWLVIVHVEEQAMVAVVSLYKEANELIVVNV